MANTFFISDTHFGHSNILTFDTYEGTKLRTFDSVEAMDEHMVERWNSVVRDGDTVYHLGDVVIAQKNLQIIQRLNGKKRLIRGNHDIFKTKKYIEVGFTEVRGVHVMNDFILSHIPLHPDSITTRFGVNVHGHLHGNRVRQASGFDKKTKQVTYGDRIDPRYFSVCVEQLVDYTPMDIDSLRENIRRQKEMYD